MLSIMSTSTPFALDHIIILLPAEILDSPPKVFTDAFTILPGGAHADGKTYNKLVILQSGVYLEFIAFIEDSAASKEGHWWGSKTAGSIIDWALASQSVEDIEKLHDFYEEPRKGGRKRLDGKSVEWYVTFPKDGMERGSVPFFCHDITPRELRVPPEGLQHPSGALGVDRIVVVATKDWLEDLAMRYEKIFGRSHDGEPKSWRVNEPTTKGGSTSRFGSGTIVQLREASDEEDAAILKMNGGIAGVKEISLFCVGKGGKDPDRVVVEDLRLARIRIGLRFVDA
ncbi:uncharacterized protein PV09_05823 [Verruconis gallopava]|uniref:Glyoxalase-like domain-containing protein n=1 Tax=Verruconis gallopava TaxID=253628 RepID=A0A0D1YQ70_9PEZI|nr:uncharacterized protein PV09_05823 [Verruconis gallopava]KIW02752.1 hypothetical protein PV09_05823 [Verruconis gallopava]